MIRIRLCLPFSTEKFEYFRRKIDVVLFFGGGGVKIVLEDVLTSLSCAVEKEVGDSRAADARLQHAAVA